MADWIAAVIIAIVEGLTEFIPVSSTGMMLLTKEALGLKDPFWNTFAVMIQLGAILAVVALYFGKLWGAFLTLPSDPNSRRFALTVLIAFLPSAIVGFLIHDYIKGALFNLPTVQCIALIVGGVVLLVIDRLAPEPREGDAMKLSLKTAFAIGLFQCLAVVPGVSRSGATIVGSMLMRVEKRAAAEFSFFLAVPTMVGAFALDAWESREAVTGEFLGVLAVGFVVSFISGAFVIKTMIGFVARHGFAPFAWWRSIVGGLGLGALYVAG